MIGLLFGGLLRNMFAGPLAILTVGLGLFAICGCLKCAKCRLRDISCCKWFLRIMGLDSFDDFELMMLVHEAHFDHKEQKLQTLVRVTAGNHFVMTDKNSDGIFQQPLHIEVEQGTSTVVVELMDVNDRVLAVTTLDILKDILRPKTLLPEMQFGMKPKVKKIKNPKISLTLVVCMGDDDAEKGMLSGTGMNSDVDMLVRQQLRKAKEDSKEAGLSEMEVLKQACAGPLELFEGLGSTSSVYVAVLGPPISRRWVLGIWPAKRDFDNKAHALKEVELLKIESVQADPTRHHVFFLTFLSTGRVQETLTLRRIDRARDVWVEILHLLVVKAREAKYDSKNNKTARLNDRESHDDAPRARAATEAPSRQKERSIFQKAMNIGKGKSHHF